MNKFLMLGTSLESVRIVEYVKQLGIHTIVADNQAKEMSPAKMIADEDWLVSVDEIDELARLCKENGVTGIFSGISEFCLDQMVELTQKLGLPCYCTEEAWRISRNKRLFKEACKKVGLQVAEDYVLSEHPTDEELDKITFPIVIKPIDACSNRGLSFCYKKDDVLKAIEEAHTVSSSKDVIAEQRINGDDLCAYYALAEGESVLLGINGCHYEKGTPSCCYTFNSSMEDYTEQYIFEINDIAKVLLKHIGCTNGIVWIQYMYDYSKKKFYAIEMGYRLPGDSYLPTVARCTGFDAMKWIVDYSLGVLHKIQDLPVELKSKPDYYACVYMLWTKKSGIIKEIIGIDKIEQNERIQIERFGYLKIGGFVNEYRPVVNIMINATTKEELRSIICDINTTVKVINSNDEDLLIRYTGLNN